MEKIQAAADYWLDDDEENAMKYLGYAIPAMQDCIAHGNIGILDPIASHLFYKALSSNNDKKTWIYADSYLYKWGNSLTRIEITQYRLVRESGVTSSNYKSNSTRYKQKLIPRTYHLNLWP